MVEIIYIISFLLFLIGILGTIFPILPGPLISYIGVILLYNYTDIELTQSILVYLGVSMVLVSIGDYLIQVIGVKKLGGGKNAIAGTIIGMIVGLFFPPVGMLLGAFVGAFLGAKKDTNNEGEALKIALGAFLGFIVGTVLKLIYCVYIFYYIIKVL